MSGDAGLHEQPVVFYSKKMTEAKIIVLKHKGIKLNFPFPENCDIINHNSISDDS